MVTVGELMKQDLVSVDIGTSVIDAAKLMKACNVGSVLVAKNGHLIGIVTEADIVRKFVGADRVTYFTPVEEVMSSPILGIDARRPITEAADMMNRHHTRHLGIMKSGALVGVISVRDFLRPVSVDEF